MASSASTEPNQSTKPPHIIFVLADDVGWNDFGYNTDQSPIPTPFIDHLAKQSVQLKQHYMHSVCTPSRASLMTGKYHINTGLTFVLAPATPAGLPEDMPTLPLLLKEHANYKTVMTGKWHLGNAKHSQTPVGRGFDAFTGIYMWDTDSYTKQMWELPWEPPLMVDWVKEFSNGTHHHYAEPRHATEAITSEAEESIIAHAKNSPDDPLFLYVAFTAAHSPLQPLPRHDASCNHIEHLWRRQYCGMVGGIDEGLKNITEAVRSHLGENTILVLTSDNGGSPWFGGLNAPLRGTKGTPFEGGQRVPGLIFDFSSDQRYLADDTTREQVQTQNNQLDKSRARQFFGLMHVADWLPTLLSYAGVDTKEFSHQFDGQDFTNVLKRVPVQEEVRDLTHLEGRFAESPRKDLLLEMYFSNESAFGESLVAYRQGDLKLIKGIARDPSYYHEATADYLNVSDNNALALAAEKVIRFGDWVFGSARFDMMRLSLTHIHFHDAIVAKQKKDPALQLRLFNVTADPYETRNLAFEPWAKDVIAEIEGKIEGHKQSRLPPQPTHKIFYLNEIWRKTRVDGDCSMNPAIAARDCKFTRPWIEDSVDAWSLPGLLSIREHSVHRVQQLVVKLVVGALVLVVGIYFRYIRPARRAQQQKK